MNATVFCWLSAVVGFALFALVGSDLRKLLKTRSALSDHPEYKGRFAVGVLRYSLLTGAGLLFGINGVHAALTDLDIEGVGFAIPMMLMGIWVLIALPSLAEAARKTPNSSWEVVKSYFHVLMFLAAFILGTYWIVSGFATIF
jgi:FtsH-binding integral membrane protein